MKHLALFDIDKTLLVGSHFHYLAMKQAVKNVYGVENPGHVPNLQGMTDLQILYATLSQEGLKQETIDGGIDECMNDMVTYFRKNVIKENIICLDGVKDVLENLKQFGIPRGLVTGNIEQIAWLKLEKIRVKDYFGFGGFGNESADRSLLVRHAVERAGNIYGTFNKENVFVIGDTPRDILAGQKNGVRTVGVATGDFTVDELEATGADFVLQNLKDMKIILKIASEMGIDVNPGSYPVQD
ncbi:HAD family hydrolase [Methanobacterium paludis]|uniref:Haloacid dehalogenase domain protein hydrolase n=1 Tax=Methanobacterium paludis (strain DSM 25820 / JCM 18151 / SWAN1) TaxID=868131 RepID=F6D7Q4_METPW|nr:HAD family hydrolase [Methanobacterium paludis]AEG17133.1 Haloacid dehalogenase domain protein hydrolase [Methanobacterium paludis]